MKKLNPICSIGVLLVSFLLAGMTLTVQASSYKSFVKDIYYLGAGGVPPTLSAFAADPRAFLRSEAAYQSLKQGFEKLLHRSLSDGEFTDLLASHEVRTKLLCEGRILTSGINDVGDVAWSERECYFNEYLIELRVGDTWYVVASQGCFNLVESQTEMTSNNQVPVKKMKIIREVTNHSPDILYIPDVWFGLNYGNYGNYGNGGNGNIIRFPGIWTTTPRSPSTSIQFE